MKRTRGLAIRMVLAALAASPFASGSALQASPPQGETAAPPTAAPAPQGLPQVCLDVQTHDTLTRAFADRLRAAISASGALKLAPTNTSCNLQLHVPGNLLRFQTPGGILVGTVVIVTSSSDRYLSTSVTACQASNLEPCAVRAIAAAKLAMLVANNDGT